MLSTYYRQYQVIQEEGKCSSNNTGPCVKKYLTYLTNKLVNYMLKDRLRHNLRDDETKNANDKHSRKVKPQSGEILNKLKLSNGHACRNVFNRPQDFINGNVHMVMFR